MPQQIVRVILNDVDYSVLYSPDYSGYPLSVVQCEPELALWVIGDAKPLYADLIQEILSRADSARRASVETEPVTVEESQAANADYAAYVSDVVDCLSKSRFRLLSNTAECGIVSRGWADNRPAESCAFRVIARRQFLKETL